MTVEADLRSLLTTSTSIAALSSNRVYQNHLIQAATYPAISYNRISTVYTSCMGTDVANVAARFQIDCWDDDPTGVNALAMAVKTAIQRYGSTSGTVVIETIFIDDHYVVEQEDLDENLYRVSIDAIVHYKD